MAEMGKPGINLNGLSRTDLNGGSLSVPMHHMELGVGGGGKRGTLMMREDPKTLNELMMITI